MLWGPERRVLTSDVGKLPFVHVRGHRKLPRPIVFAPLNALADNGRPVATFIDDVRPARPSAYISSKSLPTITGPLKCARAASIHI
jgi:hypothetical protein